MKKQRFEQLIEKFALENHLLSVQSIIFAPTWQKSGSARALVVF